MKNVNVIDALDHYAKRSILPADMRGINATCEEAIARIKELERAAGAAAMAMALDTIRQGQHLDKAEPNAAITMICDAVGLSRTDPHDLVRFRNEYMERFKPREEDKNDG